MTFMLKKKIKLWEIPLTLANRESKFKCDEEEPLHSCGLAVFEDEVVVMSNEAGVFAEVKYSVSDIEIQGCSINRDNYNPYRIGSEDHNEVVDMRNPMVVINDYNKREEEDVKYYKYPEKVLTPNDKIGKYVLSEKLGNLLVIADSYLNIIFFQSPIWTKIAGIINLNHTLPKFWNIFKFSDKEIKEVEFVLNFIENEEKIMQNSTSSIIRSLVEMYSGESGEALKNPKISSITISQLIQEDMLKNKNSNLKSFRSCSLREKKMVLEKERDEK